MLLTDDTQHNGYADLGNRFNQPAIVGPRESKTELIAKISNFEKRLTFRNDGDTYATGACAMVTLRRSVGIANQQDDRSVWSGSAVFRCCAVQTNH